MAIYFQRSDKMRQSKWIVSLSSSFQPATEFYKLINQTVSAHTRLWFRRENKDYSA